MRDEQSALTKLEKTEADLDRLVDLACDLTTAYLLSDPSERRALLRNCIADMTIRQGALMIQPMPWLETLQTMDTDSNALPNIDLIKSAYAQCRPVENLRI